MNAKDTAVNGPPLFTSLDTYLAHAKTVKERNEIIKIFREKLRICYILYMNLCIFSLALKSHVF